MNHPEPTELLLMPSVSGTVLMGRYLIWLRSPALQGGLTVGKHARAWSSCHRVRLPGTGEPQTQQAAGCLTPCVWGHGTQPHPAPQPWSLPCPLLTSPQPRVGPCSLPLSLSPHEHLSCPVSSTDRNPRWAALSSASCWPLRTVPSPLTRRHLLGDPYLPTAPQAPRQVLPILHHPQGLQVGTHYMSPRISAPSSAT